MSFSLFTVIHDFNVINTLLHGGEQTWDFIREVQSSGVESYRRVYSEGQTAYQWQCKENLCKQKQTKNVSRVIFSISGSSKKFEGGARYTVSPTTWDKRLFSVGSTISLVPYLPSLCMHQRKMQSLVIWRGYGHGRV